MDNDDRQIGRILSRREVLALFGAAGAALLVGCGSQQSGAGATAPALNTEAQTTEALASNSTAVATAAAEVATAAAGNTVAAPACVVRPEVTEGPYYVDVDLLRSDIRSDTTTGEVKAGAPLVLTFNVSQVSNGSCTPLQGATVEIWHCDAAGSYSGVTDTAVGFDTQGQNWLRGGQVTDANGVATFTTIYPGWYMGRAVHIHFKVAPNESQVFTSQLFFDDAFTDQVFTQSPYAEKGQRDQLNRTDGIYNDLLLVAAAPSGDGYAATFAIGIDPSTIGTGDSGGPGGPGGPPPGGGPPPRGTATPGG